MRFALIAASLAMFSGTAAFAEDADKDVKAAEHKAIDGKAVNTIDPVTGDKVDAKIAPIEAKTKDGKVILIGAATGDTAATIKKSPEKYVDAALANKKSEETKK